MNGITVTDVRVHPGDSGFLLDDGVTSILYDSGFGFTGKAMAEKIENALGKRSLDYIFLTHSHYDHVLGSAGVLHYFPDAQVVASEYTASVFRRPGALATMAELDSIMARRCREEYYVFPGEGLRVDVPVKDGDIIRAGSMTFEVLSLPGHTKCSVGFYCREKALLLSCETLGVYDGNFTIAPAFLVGYQMTLDSIDRVSELEIRNIISPHMGLLDKNQTSWLLRRMRGAACTAAECISERLLRGESESEIFDWYFDKYIECRFQELYPLDAAKLNTSIMTKLIGKELLGR